MQPSERDVRSNPERDNAPAPRVTCTAAKTGRILEHLAAGSVSHCDYDTRFGFKCETCAASAPCPHLLPTASVAVADAPRAASPMHPEKPQQRSNLDAECANEIIPCEECATGASCPMLSALQQLQLSSALSVNALSTANKDTEGDVFKHAHVWRSLCRRAIWHYATVATGASAVQGSTNSGATVQIPHDALPYIAPERLALHRRMHSCWLSADGKVFDATLFLCRHPAGAEVILKYAGGDCSEDLSLHSAGAQSLWHTYCIGTLACGKFLGRGGGRLRCGNGANSCAECAESAADEPRAQGNVAVAVAVEIGGRRSLDKNRRCSPDSGKTRAQVDSAGPQGRLAEGAARETAVAQDGVERGRIADEEVKTGEHAVVGCH